MPRPSITGFSLLLPARSYNHKHPHYAVLYYLLARCLGSRTSKRDQRDLVWQAGDVSITLT